MLERSRPKPVAGIDSEKLTQEDKVAMPAIAWLRMHLPACSHVHMHSAFKSM